MDSDLTKNSEIETSLHDILADDKQNDPADLLEEQELKVHLIRAIKDLSERQQIILSLYYYEELTLKEIGAVIGDVSGHGIPSALLMASVRSSLRQRALSGGDVSQIISDVNLQLARDVEESGRFMTLFYSEIDSQEHRIRWVRAGHDPAIFYDPETDTFEELMGPGMALGVDEDWQYEENQKIGLKKGQIIVLATDGIWEAHDARGDMFGKDSFYEIIRRHAAKRANQILDAVYHELAHFQRGVEPEDDVTLVVIKIEA